MKIHWLVSIVFFSLLVFSCDKPVEGCSDINAKNYNVKTDEDCENCCIYPQIDLKFFYLDQRGSDAYYSFSKEKTVDGQNYFKIEDFIFYISGLKLQNGTSSFYPSDSISLSFFDTPDKTFVDDVRKLNVTNTSRVKFGAFEGNKIFNKFSFYFGVNEDFSGIVDSLVPNNSALKLNSDSMRTFDGFLSYKLYYKKDTSSKQIDTLISRVDKALSFSFEMDFETNRGYNKELKMGIYFGDWFDGLNFSTENETILNKKIVDNLESAFDLIEE